MKKILIAFGCVLGALLIVVGGYVGYVFLSYERIEDDLALTVVNNTPEPASCDQEFSVVTWNIGFGAYSDDYSFFMDGGTESRAYSEAAVYSNLDGVVTQLQSLDADFCFVEEVDIDSTRSYHVDQKQILLDAFSSSASVFAQNYDSAYLFYPILEPHGASKSGMLTLSRYEMGQSVRRSLPIESGFMKFLDLDRCYSVTRIPLDNGKDLCLFCVHLSAYTSDGTIADEQLAVLSTEMQAEYENGNYIVCGGDFNKDLLGDSAAVFGVSGEEFTWAQPLRTDLLPEDFQVVAPLDEADPVPSCRNADIPYEEGTSFVITVDGFIVSPNVTVTSSEVIDAGFTCSDHNPVYMTFTLE